MGLVCTLPLRPTWVLPLGPCWALPLALVGPFHTERTDACSKRSDKLRGSKLHIIPTNQSPHINTYVNPRIIHTLICTYYILSSAHTKCKILHLEHAQIRHIRPAKIRLYELYVHIYVPMHTMWFLVCFGEEQQVAPGNSYRTNSVL